MKLSYPIAVGDANCKVQAFCDEFDSAFPFLAENGYEGVELLVRDPFTVNISAVEQRIHDHGLSLSAIGTSPMQSADRLFFLDAGKEKRQEAWRRCEKLMELAGYFKVPLLIGKYRGNIQDVPGCRREDFLIIIKHICGLAGEQGIRVLIEPQSPGNINNIHTIAEGVGLIRELGYDNLGILADIYHMGVNEEPITEVLRTYLPYIGMIHMSDSMRMAPALGILPIAQVIKILNEVGFEGYVSMEIKQFPDSRTAARIAAANIRYLEAWEKHPAGIPGCPESRANNKETPCGYP